MTNVWIVCSELNQRSILYLPLGYARHGARYTPLIPDQQSASSMPCLSILRETRYSQQKKPVDLFIHISHTSCLNSYILRLEEIVH